MITATGYLTKVNRVRDDILTASNASGTLGSGLEKLDFILEIPGKLEDKLRVPANALDLPDVLVVPLSFAPVIGPAVKTIDNISEATSEQIEIQADAMGALDDSWAPLRQVVDVLSNVNEAAGVALTGFNVEHTFRLDEAALLSVSLGTQTIYGDSELAARIKEYEDAADIWFDTQEELLAPVQAAAAALEKAADDLAALLPDLGIVDDVLDAVNSVFAPIADALSEIEDALCVIFEVTPEIVVPPVVITPEIVIPPVYVLGVLVPGTGITIPAVITPGFTIPAVVVDICGIIEDIGNQVQIVQDFVEGVITDVLGLIGIDLGGLADDLQDLLLTPLQPVLDALDDLLAFADPLIDTLNGLVDSLAEDLNTIVEDLRDVVDLGSLFDDRTEGDAGGEAVTDVLDGTDIDNAFFGLGADDTLLGRKGNDFLFGGLANDILSGGADDDEAYGGAGRDQIAGDDGNDLVDGGFGFDRLAGGKGLDTIIGGRGFDILNGGADADEFVILAGSGFEYIMDFEDNLDSLVIEADLVAGASAGDAIPEDFLSERNGNTTVKVDGARVIVSGIDATNLIDDIILI
ncbi:calcium-binding protein [Dinoroseobacter sp. S124A]|uniref:calcium-binding protein n=1 Tax=Dinoroseobacter sp. S124A TaxID=3415128 RepID=UPI003C7C48F2